MTHQLKQRYFLLSGLSSRSMHRSRVQILKPKRPRVSVPCLLQQLYRFGADRALPVLCLKQPIQQQRLLSTTKQCDHHYLPSLPMPSQPQQPQKLQVSDITHHVGSVFPGNPLSRKQPQKSTKTEEPLHQERVKLWFLSGECQQKKKEKAEAKGKSKNVYSRDFADTRIIRVMGGNGGNGCCSYSKHARHILEGPGEPSGGKGGKGGSVLVALHPSCCSSSRHHNNSSDCSSSGSNSSHYITSRSAALSAWRACAQATLPTATRTTTSAFETGCALEAAGQTQPEPFFFQQSAAAALSLADWSSRAGCNSNCIGKESTRSCIVRSTGNCCSLYEGPRSCLDDTSCSSSVEKGSSSSSQKNPCRLLPASETSRDGKGKKSQQEESQQQLLQQKPGIVFFSAAEVKDIQQPQQQQSQRQPEKLAVPSSADCFCWQQRKQQQRTQNGSAAADCLLYSGQQATQQQMKQRETGVDLPAEFCSHSLQREKRHQQQQPTVLCSSAEAHRYSSAFGLESLPGWARGEDGGHGGRGRRPGVNGKDCILYVPLGVEIYEVEDISASFSKGLSSPEEVLDEENGLSPLAENALSSGLCGAEGVSRFFSAAQAPSHKETDAATTEVSLSPRCFSKLRNADDDSPISTSQSSPLYKGECVCSTTETPGPSRVFSSSALTFSDSSTADSESSRTSSSDCRLPSTCDIAPTSPCCRQLCEVKPAAEPSPPSFLIKTPCELPRTLNVAERDHATPSISSTLSTTALSTLCPSLQSACYIQEKPSFSDKSSHSSAAASSVAGAVAGCSKEVAELPFHCKAALAVNNLATHSALPSWAPSASLRDCVATATDTSFATPNAVCFFPSGGDDQFESLKQTSLALPALANAAKATIDNTLCIYGERVYRRRRLLGSFTSTASLPVVVAAGGRGGRGNSRAAAVAAEGESGEEKLIEISLKSIAHVGLLGRPNAGKSSLLAALSRCLPRIAPFPFTTQQPLVGTVHYADGLSLLLADLPGLAPAETVSPYTSSFAINAGADVSKYDTAQTGDKTYCISKTAASKQLSHYVAAAATNHQKSLVTAAHCSTAACAARLPAVGCAAASDISACAVEAPKLPVLERPVQSNSQAAEADAAVPAVVNATLSAAVSTNQQLVLPEEELLSLPLKSHAFLRHAEKTAAFVYVVAVGTISSQISTERSSNNQCSRGTMAISATLPYDIVEAEKKAVAAADIAAKPAEKYMATAAAIESKKVAATGAEESIDELRRRRRLGCESGREAVAEFLQLFREVASYSAALAKRPFLVVASKCDICPSLSLAAADTLWKAINSEEVQQCMQRILRAAERKEQKIYAAVEVDTTTAAVHSLAAADARSAVVCGCNNLALSHNESVSAAATNPGATAAPEAAAHAVGEFEVDRFLAPENTVQANVAAASDASSFLSAANDDVASKPQRGRSGDKERKKKKIEVVLVSARTGAGLERLALSLRRLCSQ